MNWVLNGQRRLVWQYTKPLPPTPEGTMRFKYREDRILYEVKTGKTVKLEDSDIVTITNLPKRFKAAWRIHHKTATIRAEVQIRDNQVFLREIDANKPWYQKITIPLKQLSGKAIVIREAATG